VLSCTKIGIEVSTTASARENPVQISSGIARRLKANPIIACVMLEIKRIMAAMMRCSVPIGGILIFVHYNMLGLRAS
jgi:hypothetical protein